MTVPAPPLPAQIVGTHLLRGTPDGALVDAGPAATLPQSILTGGIVVDADGDSDLDVLNESGTWSNDGTGFFALVGPNFGGYVPIAAADIDGDGDADLLARWTGSQTATALLRRTAQGTYVLDVLAGPHTTSTGFHSAVFADVDDDGDPDVVATVRLPNNTEAVRVFENTAGAFAVTHTWAANGAIVAGDFDGDGRTDVVITGQNSFALHRRLGPGLVYAPPVVFAGQWVTTAADLDQDGDVDLCGSVVYWNRRFEGLGAGGRRQYGTSGAGSAGYRPTLSVVGTLRPDSVPQVRVMRGLGGMPSLLFASTVPANVPNALPGVTSYIGAPDVVVGFSLGGPTGLPGHGAVDLPLPIPPGAGAVALYLQAVVLDPAGPVALVHSNGTELRVGF